MFYRSKRNTGTKTDPKMDPPNRTRIALNTRFVEIIRVWVHKNTVFYRVNRTKISKKSPIEKDVDFMTIYPRKHGWFEHPPREYTVFSRVKRDSRSPYFDQTCRFTPVLPYKMSMPINLSWHGTGSADYFFANGSRCQNILIIMHIGCTSCTSTRDG